MIDKFNRSEVPPVGSITFGKYEKEALRRHWNNMANGGLLVETPARIEATAPTQYRLVIKKHGGLVLQGLFTWQEGPAYGADWRDIPTINEE